MIVTTINVNGIRAAVKQRSAENLGLLPWLTTTRADVVCLQETRADDGQLAGALAPALDDGWHLAHAAPSRSRVRSARARVPPDSHGARSSATEGDPRMRTRYARRRG